MDTQGRRGARGVKNSCVARKCVCVGMCCDCKKQPRTGGGMEPKRIEGDLYAGKIVERVLRGAGSV